VILGVVEVIALVALMVTTAFFVYSNNRMQATLRATHSKMKATEAQLTSTQTDLGTTKNTLTGQRQLSEYAGAFLKGSDSISAGWDKVGSACQGTATPACRAAVAELGTQVNAIQGQINGETVPPSLSEANQEITQGLDMESAAVTKVRQALDQNNGELAAEGAGLDKQAWSHLDRGGQLILDALSAPGQSA
jgi:hypothetical protein